MAREKHTNDLGRDKVGGLLLRLAVPAIAAQLVNALYNIVDRIYIGNIEGIGGKALAGVGVTFPILMIISAFTAFIGMGGAPRVAIKMGEGKNDDAENILGNCVGTLIVISVVLTAVFLIFGNRLLMMFGASNDTIGYAASYMNIYVMGTIFVQIAVGLNSFISTQGFATISMFTVLIGAALNIILDPILIFGFHMGVQGAAIATVFSQGVSAAWVLKFLFSKKSKIKIRLKYLKPKLKIIAPVFALGVSPFIMQSTESIVMLSLNSSLQKYGGDNAVSAMTILSSVMQFCMMPLAGMTQSAQPIISFNYGANKMDRVRQAFKYTFIICLSYSTAIWLSAMLVPQMYVRLFASDSTIVSLSIWAMRIYMAGIFGLGAQTSCQQTFVALGQAKTSVLLAALRKIILLIPLIYILPLFIQDKVFAVFLAEPVADVIAVICTVTVFFLSVNKILAKKSAESAERKAAATE